MVVVYDAALPLAYTVTVLARMHTAENGLILFAGSSLLLRSQRFNSDAATAKETIKVPLL